MSLRNYSCCKGIKLSFTCTDKYSQLKLRRSEALNKHSLQLVSMRIISISGDKMTPISELDDRNKTPNFVRWHKGTDIRSSRLQHLPVWLYAQKSTHSLVLHTSLKGNNIHLQTPISHAPFPDSSMVWIAQAHIDKSKPEMKCCKVRKGCNKYICVFPEIRMSSWWMPNILSPSKGQFQLTAYVHFVYSWWRTLPCWSKRRVLIVL